MGIKNFTGETFLPDEKNRRKSDFVDSNLFQSQQQPSVNTEHQ